MLREEEPRYNIQNSNCTTRAVATGCRTAHNLSLSFATLLCRIVVVYCRCRHRRPLRLFVSSPTLPSPVVVVVAIEKFCHLYISLPIQLHKREKETLPFGNFSRIHFMCVFVLFIHCHMPYAVLLLY